MSDRYPEVAVEHRTQWRAWLTANYGTSPGIWLMTWKQDSGRPHVSSRDINEEALCFGWVDSRPRSVDTSRRAILVTPRRPTSKWSRVNKERVERLAAAGLMTEAGLEAVRIAKANGTWTALDAIEDLIEPPDLAAALDAQPAAREFWTAFPRSTRRAILEWIASAKTDATRAARIRRTADEAAVNVRANQWRQPKRRA